MLYILNDGKGYATEFIDNKSVTKLTDTMNGKINQFKEAIEYIKQNDKDFYRIAKSDISQQNTSLLYDYHSIQTYLSIGNGYVYDLSHKLEDNHCTTTRGVNGMNGRTQAMTLLGTKYYICDKNDKKYVPYGYQLYHEIGDTQIYLNSNALPLGIFYNNYILQEEYDKLTPLQKEQALLTTAVLKDNIEEVKKEEDIINKVNYIKKIGYKEKGNLIQDNKVKIKKKNQSIYLELNDIEKDTELYLNIKNLKFETKSKSKEYKITVSFNGRKDSEKVEDRIISAYYEENPDFLINLGVIRGNEDKEIEITFNNKGTYSFDAIDILAVPMKQYEEKVEKLKQSQMTDIIYGNDYISGQVKNNTNGILQITTSYSNGWKAFIDGKEAEIMKVNEGFIGIFVSEGTHKVEFKYATPYLNLGIIISILGLMIFVGLFIFEKKKK